MTDLIPFRFENAQIRVVSLDGDPWFVGKDVAEMLGYTNPAKAMSDHCKGVTKRYPLPTAGGVQETRVLSEPDVLRLIVSSRLPAAQRFEAWVFEVLLPTIRRTGRFEAGSAPRDWIAEADKVTDLIARIRAEPDATARQTLHSALAGVCRGMDAPVPSLDGLVATAPVLPHHRRRRHHPEVAETFWRAIEQMEAGRNRLDHSRNPSRVAYSLPQVFAVAAATRTKLPENRTELRRALAAHPRFIGRIAVASALTGKTVKCWVFARLK